MSMSPAGPFDQDQPGNGIEVVTGKAPESWVEKIQEIPWISEEDGGSAIMQQIWDASSIEEIGAELAGRSITKLGLVGKPLQIRSIALAPSEYDQRLKVYAVVEAVDGDGTPVVFSAGGIACVQLVAWKLRDAFPLNVKIIEIPSRKAGRNPALRFILESRAAVAK